MLDNRCSDLLMPRTYHCATLDTGSRPDDGVSARHAGVFGFDQSKLAASSWLIVGNGMGSEIGEGGVRKGIGEIRACDGDTVDATNLNRQFFYAEDIGKNKALCMAKNLSHHGFLGTNITGYPGPFQMWESEFASRLPDVIVCVVDNDPGRVAVAKFGLKYGRPVVFSALSIDADQGYVFVQAPGGPCFGCLFPNAVDNEKHPCPGTPAVKDIVKTISGVVLYAGDTLIMDRRRNWNYRQITLAGFIPDQTRWIDKRPDCALCSLTNRESHDTNQT